MSNQDFINEQVRIVGEQPCGTVLRDPTIFDVLKVFMKRDGDLSYLCMNCYQYGRLNGIREERARRKRKAGTV